MTAQLAEPTERYDLSRLPMGVDLDDGSLWTQSLQERHVLAGGVPGAGKSAYLNALVALCAALPEVQVAAIDRKKGAEFKPWLPRLCRLATTLEEAGELLDDVRRLVDARYDVLAEQGRRNAWEEDVYGDPRISPLVLVVDELQLILAPASRAKEDRDAAAQREAALTELVLLARAAGVVIVLATQRPLAEAVPTNIRDNVQSRVAFATTTDVSTDVILGQGAAKLGANPKKFNKPGWAGCATTAEEGREGFRDVRVVYMTDQDVRGRAATTAHLRDDPWRYHPGLAPTTTTSSGLHVPPPAGSGARVLREAEPPAGGSDDSLARELFEEE